MFCLKHYLTLILLFAGMAVASAQQQVWDAALDWYGNICAKCTDWRDRIGRGESVPKDSLKLMMGKLDAVKRDLKSAWYEMTPSQRRRYEAIRDCFVTGRWPVDAISSDEASPVLPYTCHLCRVPKEKLMLSLPSSFPSFKPKNSVRISPLIGLVAGVYPDFSLGAVLGLSIGSRLAVFALGRSNFHLIKTSYDCLSDGTSGESVFWGDGTKGVCRHQLTLDFAYSLSSVVRIYAGAGYGARMLCWRDFEGSWARVTDRSTQGLAVNAGVIISPFSISGASFFVGGSLIPNGRYLDLESGLCWWF